MKTAFLIAFSICSLSFGGGSLFKADPTPSSDLAQKEAGILNAVKNGRAANKVKVISIDQFALSAGVIEIELFKGTRGEFEVSKITVDDGDSLWSGHLIGKDPGNHDWFSLRKVNGRYTGHVILRGHNYVIIPISKGKSVLVEEDLNFTCGTNRSNKNQEKSK